MNWRCGDLPPGASAIPERLEGGTQNIWMIEPVFSIGNGYGVVQPLPPGTQANQRGPTKEGFPDKRPVSCALLIPSVANRGLVNDRYRHLAIIETFGRRY
jgi:hypothetical protein